MTRTPDRDAFRELFEASGPFVVDTAVGGRRYNDTGRTRIIERVHLHRELAGASGTTTVDVNINGTTIFTAPAQRPTVTAASGNDATGSADLETLAVFVEWLSGDYLTVDVDTVEDGYPENLTITVVGI